MSSLPNLHHELYDSHSPHFLTIKTTRSCSYIIGMKHQNQFYLNCHGSTQIQQNQEIQQKIEKLTSNNNDNVIIYGITTRNEFNETQFGKSPLKDNGINYYAICKNKNGLLTIHFKSSHNETYNIMNTTTPFNKASIKYKIGGAFKLHWFVDDSKIYQQKISNGQQYFPFCSLKLAKEYTIKINKF